jgi:hypothetical protein
MRREELLELGKKIKKSGFRVFIPKNEDYNWIIFSGEKNKIFYTEGKDVSIKYRPSKDYGNGCQIFNDFYRNIESRLYDLKHKDLQKLCFIPLIKISLYNNIDEFLKETWTEYSEI